MSVKYIFKCARGVLETQEDAAVTLMSAKSDEDWVALVYRFKSWLESIARYLGGYQERIRMLYVAQLRHCLSDTISIEDLRFHVWSFVIGLWKADAWLTHYATTRFQKIITSAPVSNFEAFMETLLGDAHLHSHR